MLSYIYNETPNQGKKMKFKTEKKALKALKALLPITTQYSLRAGNITDSIEALESIIKIIDQVDHLISLPKELTPAEIEW
tara:strand:+ start:161 stop:400 length:240 start_codon:yes stop_codon:yes gene_type:complete